jgi:hypothetical protein
MKDHITIAGHDSAFAAYIARPKTVPAPAVIVLQELFGVNADTRYHWGRGSSPTVAPVGCPPDHHSSNSKTGTARRRTWRRWQQ